MGCVFFVAVFKNRVESNSPDSNKKVVNSSEDYVVIIFLSLELT